MVGAVVVTGSSIPERAAASRLLATPGPRGPLRIETLFRFMERSISARSRLDGEGQTIRRAFAWGPVNAVALRGSSGVPTGASSPRGKRGPGVHRRLTRRLEGAARIRPRDLRGAKEVRPVSEVAEASGHPCSDGP